MIRAENLSLKIDKFILNDLNFSIREGEFVLIIGPNGAGKSSLLKIIDGIIRYEGSLKLNSLEIRDMTRRNIAQLISYQPQQIDFSMPVTVKDILIAGRYPYQSYFHSYSDSDIKIMKNISVNFRLNDFENREINTLSGGERKRALIASSYIQDVEIFLFDEPFSSLDPGEIVNILKILKYLKKEGKTVIVVSHNYSLFNKIADKLIALKNGKIIYSGNYTNDTEILKSTFNIDFRTIKSIDGEIVIPAEK